MPPAAPATLETDTIRNLEILRVGVGNGRKYSTDDLGHVLDAYKRLKDYGYQPYGKLGHNPQQALLAADGLPSAGQVTDLRLSVDGNAIVADVENVPKKIAQLVKAKGYGPRSAELWVNQQLIPDEPALPMALRSFAWLGADAPALKNLNDIEALYHHDVAEAEYLDEHEHTVSVIELAQTDDAKADDGSASKPTGKTKVAVARDGTHAVTTGTHDHGHPDYGATDGDSAGMHGHEHSHDNDSGHSPGNGHQHQMSQQPDAQNAEPAENEGDPKSPPKGYPTDKSKYADPTNYKYPLDTTARIHSAVSYFNAGAGKSKYSGDEWASMGRKIASAAGSGYSFSNGKITTPSTKKTTNNADLNAEDSYEDIIADLYWSLCCDDDAPFATAASCKVTHTFPDSCVVKVVMGDGYGNYDSPMPYDAPTDDVHYIVPYTREAGGEPQIGTPQLATVSFSVAPAGTEEMADETPAHAEGETMTDEEIRQTLGLADDADIKLELLKMRTNTVALADHAAVVERLERIEADAKLSEARGLVEEMEQAGQIAGPKAEVEKLRELYIDLCLNDRERFDQLKAMQPKVIEYRVLGDSGDGRLPAYMATGQAGSDLSKVDKALGVTPEMLAEREMSLAERREAWRQRQLAAATAPGGRPSDLRPAEMGRIIR